MKPNLSKNRRGTFSLAIIMTLFALASHANAQINPNTPPNHYLIVGSDSYWSFSGSSRILFCVGNEDPNSYHDVYIYCENNDEIIETRLAPGEVIGREFSLLYNPWRFRLNCDGGQVIVLAAWNLR